MVTVTGKLAKAWIEAYLNQPAAHCDFLPLSQKYYAYGAGFVTLEFEKDWKEVLPEDCFVTIVEADSIV